MTDEPSIHSRVVTVLLGLRMVSEGSTYQWGSSSHTKPGSRLLMVGEGSRYHFHHRRLSESRTRDELEMRLLEAEDALQSLKVRPEYKTASRQPADMRAELLRDFVGMTAPEAAYEMSMSVSWVRKVRKEARRHPHTGEEAPDDKWGP